MNETNWVVQDTSIDLPLREGVRRYRADLTKYRLTIWSWLYIFALSFLVNGLIFGITIALAARVLRLSWSATMVVEIVLVGLMASLVPSRVITRRRAKAGTFELLVSERVARATIEGEDTAEILRPQASRVLQTPNMFWILCDAPQRSFCVASPTEDYEALKRTFHDWAPVEQHDAKKERELRRSEADHGSTIGADDAALANDPSLADELARVRESTTKPTTTKAPPKPKPVLAWVAVALVQMAMAFLLYSGR